MVAVLGLTAALATGCARPGELGSTEPAAAQPPAPSAAAPAPPAPPTGPVLIGSGRIEDKVALRTLGPAVFSVRTVVVPPGGTTGWHRHPGTEMSVVKSGTITLLRENACEPAMIGPGQAVFIPDAQPHLARNDGTEPAELVVTYLLAPDAPDRGDVPPAC
jgi:Uncharacterized conserved protein, contains double-stranded beta-helix domain